MHMRGNMKQIDEIAMRNASIFELRNVARDIGVPSPTIYKKEELIEKIMKILTGENKPELPKTRQGRPPKVKNKLSASIAFGALNDENTQESYDLRGFLGSERLTVSDSGFVFGGDNMEYASGAGFLKFDKNGYGFLFKSGYVADPKDAIHVPSSFVKDYLLREGDYVECTCRKMDTQDASILTKVENEKDFTSRKLFEDLKSIESQKTIKFNNTSFAEGSRNVLLVNNLKGFKEHIAKFKKTHPEDKVFCLVLDAVPEDLPFEFDTFYTFAGDSEKRNVFTTELFIERVKRMVERGEKVAIFVNELLKIVKYQNFINGNSMFDAKNKSFELCLKLMRLCSNYENGGSATMFAMLKQIDNECFYSLKNELENVNCNFIQE